MSRNKEYGNFSNFKQYKTMEQVADQFPDKNRKKLYSGAGMLVQGVDGNMHEINIHQKEEDLKQQEFIKSQEAWAETDEKAEAYNANIKNLDPKYANLSPLRYMIVRCKHIIPKKHKVGDQVIYDHVSMPVAEMTQNGLGVRQTLESPWRYSTEAIVVAMPDHIKDRFSPGDLVQIESIARTVQKAGVDKDFEMPHAYMHPEYHGLRPPTDVTDEHFGYLKIDPFDHVICILEKAKVDIEENN